MNIMKYTIACIMVFLVAGGVSAQSKSEAALTTKINRVIRKMTLEEKIGMLHGNALFSSGGVP
ncbi:hypothetical protein AB6735_20290, partial [Mucilaginibacter sp. RCC_168]